MRHAKKIQERDDVRVERTQVLWLTMGFVVCLGLAFALGYGMGRRAERLQGEARAADPLARIESDEQIHDQLTFYARLLEERQPPAIQADPPASPVETAPVPPASADAAPLQAPEVPDKKPPDGIASPQDVSQALSRVRKQAAEAAPTLPPALTSGPAAPGEYTVQVSAFQSEQEAQAYAAGLRRKGYKPFVVRAAVASRGTWYCVQLGSFASRAAAEEAKDLLARADIPGWVLQAE
jgi:cell division protein FtsN